MNSAEAAEADLKPGDSSLGQGSTLFLIVAHVALHYISKPEPRRSATCGQGAFVRSTTTPQLTTKKQEVAAETR